MPDEKAPSYDLSHLRDRGTMKWTAMMLPEHVDMLRELSTVDYYKQEKPLLDEYQISEIEEKIHYVMEYAYFCVFSCWKNGFVEALIGRVHYLDPINKIIRIKDEEEFIERIKFDEIVDVKVLEEE